MLEIGPIYDENGWGSPLSIAVWSILFLTIITVVIFAVRRLRKRTNRNWQEAATELGLHFTPQQLFWLPYEMEGTLGIIGYYCKVHTLREHRAGGDSSGSHAPVTRVEVRFLESLGMEFSLRPGLGIKWLNWIDGSEDIEVGGDSDFDEHNLENLKRKATIRKQ